MSDDIKYNSTELMITSTIKTKDKIEANTRRLNKLTKPSKPRSVLQNIQSELNWALHFKLQPFHGLSIIFLQPSVYTRDLINRRNALTRQLKESIKKDAARAKLKCSNSKKKTS